MRNHLSDDPGGTDRRKFRRFPTGDGLLEPIEIAWSQDSKTGAAAQPAIMTNLSAGGMSLVTFIEPPHTKRIYLQLKLPGLPVLSVEARILRVHTKGQVHTLGLAFTKVAKSAQKAINRLSDDYNDCETRIALRLPEACVQECTCHAFCSKPQKTPSFPPAKA